MEYLSTLKLTTVDYFTLVVLLVSALVGISRGLFKELLALASWFIASWVAYHYSNYLATEWLSSFHLEELLTLGLSFLILFAVCVDAHHLWIVWWSSAKNYFVCRAKSYRSLLRFSVWFGAGRFDCGRACYIGSTNPNSSKYGLDECNHQTCY